MSDLQREKTQTSTLEYSRRLRKACPETYNPPAIGLGRVPRVGWGGCRVT